MKYDDTLLTSPNEKRTLRRQNLIQPATGKELIRGSKDEAEVAQHQGLNQESQVGIGVGLGIGISTLFIAILV